MNVTGVRPELPSVTDGFCGRIVTRHGLWEALPHEGWGFGSSFRIVTSVWPWPRGDERAGAETREVDEEVLVGLEVCVADDEHGDGLRLLAEREVHAAVGGLVIVIGHGCGAILGGVADVDRAVAVAAQGDGEGDGGEARVALEHFDVLRIDVDDAALARRQPALAGVLVVARRAREAGIAVTRVVVAVAVVVPVVVATVALAVVVPAPVVAVVAVPVEVREVQRILVSVVRTRPGNRVGPCRRARDDHCRGDEANEAVARARLEPALRALDTLGERADEPGRGAGAMRAELSLERRKAGISSPGSSHTSSRATYARKGANPYCSAVWSSDPGSRLGLRAAPAVSRRSRSRRRARWSATSTAFVSRPSTSPIFLAVRSAP